MLGLFVNTMIKNLELVTKLPLRSEKTEIKWFLSSHNLEKDHIKPSQISQQD